MCLHSNLPFNQAMRKPSLYATTDSMNRGGGFFWIWVFWDEYHLVILGHLFSVCKSVCMPVWKELWRVKETPEEFYKPLDAPNTSMCQQEKQWEGRSGVRKHLKRPFVSTQSPQISLPNSHKQFVCSMAKLWGRRINPLDTEVTLFFP